MHNIWWVLPGHQEPAEVHARERLILRIIVTAPAHHDEVVEEEHLSLVGGLLLGLADVRHLEQTAAADQPSVGHRQHLQPNTPSPRDQ